MFLNVSFHLYQAAVVANEYAAISHPGRCLPYTLEVHPHLRNPPQPLHRGRVTYNTSALLSRLRLALSRHLSKEHMVEHNA